MSPALKGTFSYKIITVAPQNSPSLPLLCSLVIFFDCCFCCFLRLTQSLTVQTDTHTLRHADLLAILALELVLLEGALPLLDVGFLLVLVQVEDEEGELALEHILLPLGQLLLTLPQELFMGLLLQSRSLQLLLTATQLLMEERGQADERDYGVFKSSGSQSCVTDV